MRLGGSDRQPKNLRILIYKQLKKKGNEIKSEFYSWKRRYVCLRKRFVFIAFYCVLYQQVG